MKKVKAGFDKLVEWDKNLLKKFQDKFGLSDYQVVCISFAKGLLLEQFYYNEAIRNLSLINSFGGFWMDS